MFDFLLTAEQRAVRDEAREFVRSIDPQLLIDMDEDKVQYPRSFVEEAAARNLLGLRFAPEWGGRGLQWTTELAVIEEIGVLGSALGCLYSLPSIVGEAIYRFGTPDQKERYLLPTLQGKKFTAEGLTEPRGGSDFFGATTTAVRKGDHYVLNGQKRFVVGAEGADYFLVYARTDPNGPPHESMSVFLVDRGPGVHVAHLYGLMGGRGGGAGRVVFRDVIVPVENRIGEENGAAQIFYQMMVPERLTSAAGAIGIARAALEVAAVYSTRRKAFGRKIKDFQGVNFKVAESITKLDAARALVYAAGAAEDSGQPPELVRRLVSEAKKFATDAAWEVTNHAMQIMGGIGYTNVFPVERLVREARLTQIWTGTNEIMNLVIQHEYYKELKNRERRGRDVERDARGAALEEEKVYE
ncbi:acyl-CoA dehydrogenase family protein [Symbiobacterium terraclitae]|uniref:acyl-CoA dehydrogenase family protein n=1 Tax=Symbiobacterium terraclitae TaxID=557451 RepID=UPI0035B568FD